MPTINVLLVDDSAIIRGLMSKALSADPQINIIGTAGDGLMAISAVQRQAPDVIVLDIEMPRMDGISALPELLKIAPAAKVIMASTLTLRNAGISMQAMALGAADYLPKPTAKSSEEVEHFYRDLIGKVKALGQAAANARVASAPTSAGAAVSATPAEPRPMSAPKPAIHPPPLSTVPLANVGVKALAVASSTGGPQALVSFFEQLKGHLQHTPIFVTQHMPANFTTILAEHITRVAGRLCAEAKEGEVVVPERIYLAPGDFHMLAEKNAVGQVMLHVNQGPQENFCRPAADPMLRSFTKIYGSQLLLIVLTGMGQDGMLGARELVAAGGNVIAQDEASCVVYGMPKAVVENHLARAVLPLSGIAPYLISQLEGCGHAS